MRLMEIHPDHISERSDNHCTVRLGSRHTFTLHLSQMNIMGVCQLSEDLTYFLCTEPVDMRKQITGLQGIVTSQMGRYPVSGEAFVFVGKNRTTVKILHREGRGMTMYVRKLSSGRFQLPSRDGDGTKCTLGWRDFMLLIRGDKPSADKDEKYAV